MERRIRIISLGFIIAFLALLVRLFYWQIIRGKDLSGQARKQHQIGQYLSAGRGNVLAKDGSLYAGRGEGWLVFASLPDLEFYPKKAADKLAPFFVENLEDKEVLLNETNRLYALLTKKEVVWVPLKHKIDSDLKNNIEALKIKGIGFEPEEVRVYPEASAAAHLLGFVGKNPEGGDRGYFGLEGFYDFTLSGKPGFVSRELDAKGVPITIGESIESRAVTGVNLLTHLDKGIQYLIERKFKDGIEKYGAKGGSVIVMNPKDGGILAMVSFPSYDPSNYVEYGDAFFKNPAISDSFEPGSIFKILIMAAALDAKAVGPDSECEICSGPLKVDKYLIETWNKEYRPNSTMTDIIVHSDNVGMVYVGQKLGIEKLYEYLDKFGIGKITGIDLQGEASAALRKKEDWSMVDLATASFGQGVAITPIQMVKAVGAIANKGKPVVPQVVDKLLGEGWEEDIKPVFAERVISEGTVALITQMMVEAAKSGEAKWTYLRGFKVAGKTGTAQIPIAGHYDEEKTIASFVGFAPYNDPKFVMLVTLREPQTSPWASETAAPLWYSMVKDLFLHFGIQPE